MKLLYYIRRFWEIASEERIMLIKGLLISNFFYLIINIVHLKYYMKLISSNKEKQLISSEDNLHFIRIIKRTLKRIELILPWKLTCLNKSITFKILSDLYQLNCSVSIAATKLNDGKLIAHSYVCRNKEIIYLDNFYLNDLNRLLTI